MHSLGSGDPPTEIPDVASMGLSYDEVADGEVIGRGGNADVFRVTVQRSGREIPVAVKQPRLQGTLDTDTVKRFVQEADVWAELDGHEHIVSLHDWGAEPLPWLAMEYMDRGTLADVPDGERLPLEQALWVGICVSRAVHHAHRFGVAHHDIKPANVLFTSSGDGWAVPKVSDWGLARLMLDETGSVAEFSPGYAAPEQFDAEEYGSPDDRTDIYQVGTLVYELVTGRPPFEGSATAVMQGVLSTKPTPPSEVADVPAELDDVLGEALAKEPDERYESILYLRDRLQELFDSLHQSPTDHHSGAVSAGSQTIETPRSDTTGRQSGGDSVDTAPQRDDRTDAPPASRGTQKTASKGQQPTEEPRSAHTGSSETTDSSRSLSRRAALGSIGLGVVGAGSWGLLQTIESDNDGRTGGNDDSGGTGGANGGSITVVDPENGRFMTGIERLDSYLNENNASGYDDTDSIEDLTGESSVTIEAGDDFQFDPAAARIDSGATVTWEWLSDGHSVERTGGEGFEDASTQNEGDTHQWRFDESGVFLYQCGPHAAEGAHGAIIIER